MLMGARFPEVDRRRAWEREQAAAPQTALTLRERRAEYRRAELAAAGSGAELSTAQRMLIRHVVDLAAETPAVTLHWMSRRSAIRQFAGGLSYTGRHTVIVPAIRGTVEYVVCLHELTHARDTAIHTRSVLMREVYAWRGALDTAIALDAEAIAEAQRGLKINIAEAAAAGLGADAIEILDAEAFVEAVGRREHRRPHDSEIETFEAGLFQEQFGIKRCAARLLCSHGSATALIGSTFCCRACAPLVEARDAIRRGQIRRAPAPGHRDLVSMGDTRGETREEYRDMRHMERATTGASGSGPSTFGRMADGLIAMAKGEARCSTCGGAAVRCARIGQEFRYVCAADACRQNAEIDREIRALRADRRRR